MEDHHLDLHVSRHRNRLDNPPPSPPDVPRLNQVHNRAGLLLRNQLVDPVNNHRASHLGNPQESRLSNPVADPPVNRLFNPVLVQLEFQATNRAVSHRLNHWQDQQISLLTNRQDYPADSLPPNLRPYLLVNLRVTLRINLLPCHQDSLAGNLPVNQVDNLLRNQVALLQLNLVFSRLLCQVGSQV